MTTEEALSKVVQHSYSCVLWNEKTGEIVSVTGFDENPTPGGACVYYAGKRDGIDARWRYFSREEVTPGLLEEEGDACLFASRRKEIADSYVEETTERLVEILERRDYPHPMDAFYGDHAIVQELVRFRREDLSEAIKQRLRGLAEGTLVASAAATLTRYLAVLEADDSAIIAEWREEPWNGGNGFEYFDLLDCLGALRVKDPQIVADLIRRIEEPGCCKSSVMTALGRMGSAAGAQAADAIRLHIDEGHLPRLRQRVLLRLCSSDEAWEPCPQCPAGWVRSDGVPVSCPTCEGLVVIPRAGTVAC